MAVRIQIFDGAIPMLDEIAAANYGQGLDALDHAGMALQKSIRSFMVDLHPWRQDYVRVGGQLKRRIRKTGANVLGLRKDTKTGKIAKTPNMQNFVNSYLNIRHMNVVVAGMHPKFTSSVRRNGEVVGRNKPVGGVSKSSYAILQKLNDGGTYDAQPPEYKKAGVRPNTMDRFANATYRKRDFIERGRSAARGRVNDIMTTKLESMIHKQINRADVKYKEVKTS